VISGIVLAAGTASRFGSTKQLVEIDGKPLVQHAIDTAATAELDEIVVVLGHDAERIERSLHLPQNARVVINESLAEGQSTSLSSGINALHPKSEAAVILLGDQPGVLPEEVRLLVERFGENRAPIVRLRYRDAPGPALLSKETWPEALQLRGDTGARALFGSHQIENLEIGRDAPTDIDTPSDAPEGGSSARR
jgi:molybdenum cofactor cytidylyltransferase